MEPDITAINKPDLDAISQQHVGIYHALMELLEGIYQEIVELDLDRETAFVLRNCNNPEQVGNSYSFTEEATIFCDQRVMLEDSEIAKAILSLDELRAFYDSGEKLRSAQLRVCTKQFVYEWVELSLFSLFNTQAGERKLLITVRNINDQKLSKSIIDNFVYNTCDYFIYLDTKANSYITFSGNSNGTPLPPAAGSDYSSEIVKYAREFVVPEDQDYVIEQMGLDLVQKALDQYGEHDFYCGVSDPIRGYTRKYLKYLYYDRENKMVLLIRTDVTGVYFLEEQKTAQLRLALQEARTDSLTGIYNRKALETLICESISNDRNLRSGYFFFIDIDHFKQINDTLGHSQGDFVLQFFSEKLRAITPPHSIVGRLGGDEFIVFCTNLDIGDHLDSLATQICCAFDTICDSDIEKVGISCSVGIALFPQHGTTYNALYQRADQALYFSKNKKKQYTVFDENINLSQSTNSPYYNNTH